MYSDAVERAAAKVAVLGASGYAGAELLRLCAGHPSMEVVLAAAGRLEGKPIAASAPNLAPLYRDRLFDSMPDGPLDPRLGGVDVVFAALPHHVSAELLPRFVGAVPHVVDLSAAFRLSDPASYPLWYGFEHPRPDLLGTAVYGLPELNRSRLPGAGLVAAPGCYVTAASIALQPLVAQGLIHASGIVVDAASGVSGAGRELRDGTQFCSVEENYSPYSVGTHRHTPEMEQAIGADLLFVPHLAPMNRGILATCYARPTGCDDVDQLLGALSKAYAGEPFVTVTTELPTTKATLGSNSVHLSLRHDARSGWVVVMAALDNLVKGAAGQALQCANVALGFSEPDGLQALGVYP